jgi:hypothetical protein
MTLPDPRTQNYGKRLRDAIREMFQVIHRRVELKPATFVRRLAAARDVVMSSTSFIKVSWRTGTTFHLRLFLKWAPRNPRSDHTVVTPGDAEASPRIAVFLLSAFAVPCSIFCGSFIPTPKGSHNKAPNPGCAARLWPLLFHAVGVVQVSPNKPNTEIASPPSTPKASTLPQATPTLTATHMSTGTYAATVMRPAM